MHNILKSPLVLLAVFLSLSIIAGCGSGLHFVPVEGVVTLDGKPIDKATVLLIAPVSEKGDKGLPATAITDTDGRFSLTSANIHKGAVPGQYQIVVTKLIVTGVLTDKFGLDGGAAPGGIRQKWIIPQKYSLPNTSGLSVEVKEGMEPLKLQLTSR
jgi:hypothetical protein